jgi:hypothetical protein
MKRGFFIGHKPGDIFEIDDGPGIKHRARILEIPWSVISAAAGVK